ncbi:MAG TPA: hypothetical protein VF517_05045 [Thermoleophilaceae bacterium]|jgi:hypothetical protein
MAAPVAIYRAVRTARRVAPLAAEAYRRWNQLSPAEKERHKERVRLYAQRGQDIGREALRRAEEQRRKRGGR